ncbi:MAG: isoleucine--tRNA ligase [Deltaproteobacteria bacterium]|jgi:isoleucyl-tRNA synthetase|nr:isoleucine--tRNA ligase [Deltaproteobacteria bacterium]
MDYKETLNLPKTDFPMKAGLAELEPKLLKRWSEMGLYQKILKQKSERPLWVLHDGPPYANGNIHMGTALNKVLKDIIIKSKSMTGYFSPYVPGWDCHGLPIEHQVDKNLGAEKAKKTRSEIRQLCREYAAKFVEVQKREFKRLGVLGEWDDPYLTMNFEYEAIIARELGEMALSGRLYHSPKPVLWCGNCRTALAEAEVEYEEHKSDSIYVAFKLVSDPAALRPDLAGEDVSLVIWTTTPWTIPANMGIAYNPSFRYGAYRLGGRVLVLSADLAETVLPKFNLGEPVSLGQINAEALFGLVARHPLYDRDSKVIPAAYVTDDQGTGLVHTAPGHGRDDYETGLAYDLPVFSPLDDQARFTEEVPELKGIKVLAANPKVIELLQEKGALLASETLEHQYPHCWRCKKPVVFRSTLQWFVSLEEDDLRKKTLSAIDQINWIPRWGRDRIYGMVENRPDWCVSRQRSWGVPITLFFCEKCGQWHYSKGIQNKLFELFKAKGADVWYELEPKDLMPQGEKCAKCGGDSFKKETDILDVWFDSGCSFAAVCEHRDYLPDKPDMYLEGSDQHRGWFHSSMLVSMANRKRPPYSEVLTHGYVVDGAGKKMSKSLGNTIEPDYVISKYGADIIRLWVSAENYQDDIRLSNAIMDMLAKAYFNFRNTARFMLGNIHDFDPAKDSRPLAEMDELDRYVLHQLAVLTTKVRKAYDGYEFHIIYQLVNKFVVLLSSLYHDVIKDRLYTLRADDPARRASQTVMWTVISSLTRLMAPILSFTAEEIWLRLKPSDDSSVFLEDFPEPQAEHLNPEEAQKFERLLELRTQAYKALEQARKSKIIGSGLEAELILTASGDDFELLSKHPNLAELFIVSQTTLKRKDEGELTAEVALCSHPKCPRCWLRRPEVPEDQSGVCDKCRKALS